MELINNKGKRPLLAPRASLPYGRPRTLPVGPAGSDGSESPARPFPRPEGIFLTGSVALGAPLPPRLAVLASRCGPFVPHYSPQNALASFSARVAESPPIRRVCSNKPARSRSSCPVRSNSRPRRNPHRVVTAGLSSLVRHPQRYHLVAVATIDSEVAIQREHLGCGVDFRKPDQAGVCQ